ncbi:MAG: hypothetical protein MJ237_08290 [bacterium]|nr:hypothetical protein [bacterium]
MDNKIKPVVKRLTNNNFHKFLKENKNFSGTISTEFAGKCKEQPRIGEYTYKMGQLIKANILGKEISYNRNQNGTVNFITQSIQLSNGSKETKSVYEKLNFANGLSGYKSEEKLVVTDGNSVLEYQKGEESPTITITDTLGRRIKVKKVPMHGETRYKISRNNIHIGTYAVKEFDSDSRSFEEFSDKFYCYRSHGDKEIYFRIDNNELSVKDDKKLNLQQDFELHTNLPEITGKPDAEIDIRFIKTANDNFAIETYDRKTFLGTYKPQEDIVELSKELPTLPSEKALLNSYHFLQQLTDARKYATTFETFLDKLKGENLELPKMDVPELKPLSVRKKLPLNPQINNEGYDKEMKEIFSDKNLDKLLEAGYLSYE